MQASGDVVRRAVESFAENFGGQPTHAARAPGRVTLIGEHTDYNDGFVLPLAIDRDTVIVARENHSQRCRVVAADKDGEMATFINDESLAPGQTAWANYIKGVIAQFWRNGQQPPSFDAAVASDVPMGSGLSSSAALEVSTATVLELLMGIRIDPVRKALWCQKAEHEFAGVPCGIMDQMVSVAGRRGAAIMIDCRSLEHQAVPVGNSGGGDASGGAALLVTNSRVHHELGSSEYPVRRRQCEQAVATLKQRYPQIKALRDASLNQLTAVREQMDAVIFRRAKHVILENDRVGMVVNALGENELETAGFLMNESHRSLRDDYQVSCRELDILAELAWSFPGVYGSRMTGGGFGGCTITLVKREAVEGLIAHITAGYRQQTGLDAICFVVEPADGAGAVVV